MKIECPPGDGKHPVLLVVISANKMQQSREFYSQVFGWQMHSLTAEITAALAAAGPAISLRSNIPDGFHGMVPFLAVNDVDETLRRVTTDGGEIERTTWTVPMIGKLARFREPSGTIYGLSDALPPGPVARMDMPFGENAKPPLGSICSLEMYTADSAVSADFFENLFGWEASSTMPQYMAFDPGAGVGGVFQSHTPSLPAVAYIYCDNVDAMLDKIDSSGGKRLANPMRVPDSAVLDTSVTLLKQGWDSLGRNEFVGTPPTSSTDEQTFSPRRGLGIFEMEGDLGATG